MAARNAVLVSSVRWTSTEAWLSSSMDHVSLPEINRSTASSQFVLHEVPQQLVVAIGEKKFIRTWGKGKYVLVIISSCK